jgi:hypothetical protein
MLSIDEKNHENEPDSLEETGSTGCHRDYSSPIISLLLAHHLFIKHDRSVSPAVVVGYLHNQYR